MKNGLQTIQLSCRQPHEHRVAAIKTRQHQWHHSRGRWEILDEEGALLKSVYQKVTFHQSGCIIQDPISRKSWLWVSEFLGIEKLISFSLIRRKQKLIRTVILICWRLPYCLNVVDIIQAITLNSSKTVFRHTARKWRNSFFDRTL